MYKNHWQSHWIFNEKHNRENISLILFNNHDIAVDMLSLLCYLQDVMREKHHLKL